jgi:hypothetical protein
LTTTVRWWPHTDDPRVASYRLRCLQIIDALSSRGVDAGLHRPTRAERPQVLVLSKRYDAATLAQALALRERAGTRLVLDVCDNHFHVDNDDPLLRRRADALRQAVSAVDQVSASSEALAVVIAAECPAQRRIAVIPDAAEAPFEPRGSARWREPRAEWALSRLQAALQRSGVDGARRLLWFGNRGSAGADGGMSDLLRIGDALHLAHRWQPLTLTVISNDRQKFGRLAADWSLPTFYLDWRAHTFSRAARLHGAALIPVGLNPFTRCKTNNRAATAFVHGLNVIADSIPSYQEFAGCAVLDDWPRGLGAYLGDTTRRAADVEAARRLVAERYSLDSVAARWHELVVKAASDGGDS